MRPVDAKLGGDIGAHAHRAAAHVDVEPLDVERGEEELRLHIVVVEVLRVLAPHREQPLGVGVAVAVPVFRIAVDGIGRERPPECRMAAGRRVGRIDLAVAGAVAHKHVGELAVGAVLEALRDLVDVVHAEEDVEGAVDVGVEGARPVERPLTQRQVQGDQGVVAPVPVVELVAHLVGEQLFAGHAHGAVARRWRW